MAEPEFAAGVDGCPGGWVCFLVDVRSGSTSVQVIDLSVWLRNRPPGLACIGIDIPIGCWIVPGRAILLLANS
jgi:predicted RNase H-like nuclease